MVLAALTPAASVVSLDVVGADSGSRTSDAVHTRALELSAYARKASAPALVDRAPVEPRVRKIALTTPTGKPLAGLAARAGGDEALSARVVSKPQAVSGFGAVGVTWARGTQLADDQITVESRTLDNGRWSKWTQIEFHDEHGPDPKSAEGRRAIPGTDPLLVGRVDDVQVRATTAKGVPMPAGMQVSLIDPGTDRVTARARPELSPTQASDTAAYTAKTNARAAFTPMPAIFSRAQWGADERMRGASSPKYYEVHAGFVHHTVTGNDYTQADVPGIIRGIYAFHTKSRGWSDIGYNFLVDKFGRIWEGRYGGIDRPVVGAHTLGYNEYSFAMSAIGNYETANPTPQMLQAYGAIFAWKLSLHGVSASSPAQQVGRKTFQAINGHRDAGSTACPGRNLYAELPTIRAYAAGGQVGWSGRERESNLMGTAHPDLIVRRASDKQAFIIQTAGSGAAVASPVATGVDLSSARQVLNVGDWDRDGNGDFMTRQAPDNALWLYRGDGAGGFAAPVQVGTAAGLRLLSAVGDITGDGYPDLMAQPKGASMRIYVGAGMGGFSTSYVAYSPITARQFIGIGLMNGDGAPDGLYVTKGPDRVLMLVGGNGPGGLTKGARQVKKRMQRFDWVLGVSDVDVTGHADLVVRRKSNGALLVMPGSESGFGRAIKIGNASGFDLAG